MQGLSPHATHAHLPLLRSIGFWLASSDGCARTDLWSAAINFVWSPGASVDTASRGSNERLTQGPLHAPEAKHLCICQSGSGSSIPSSSSFSSTLWPTVEAKKSFTPRWRLGSRIGRIRGNVSHREVIINNYSFIFFRKCKDLCLHMWKISLDLKFKKWWVLKQVETH